MTESAATLVPPARRKNLDDRGGDRAVRPQPRVRCGRMQRANCRILAAVSRTKLASMTSNAAYALVFSLLIGCTPTTTVVNSPGPSGGLPEGVSVTGGG